jgi:hypothetical protein
VPVIGDVTVEQAEFFFVNLSNAVNATIGDASGFATIVDDDGTRLLSINDVAVVEGDSGTTSAVFTVSLSAATTQTATVAFATANSTATAPGDYTTTSGTLTFARASPRSSSRFPWSGTRSANRRRPSRST